jgi:hypothetical protein
MPCKVKLVHNSFFGAPLEDKIHTRYQMPCKVKLVHNSFFGAPLEDKVLCHFCFKPKKVTDEVLKPPNGRKPMLISDVIVLKTALDALPVAISL